MRMSNNINREKLAKIIALSLLEVELDVDSSEVLSEWLNADKKNHEMYEQIRKAYLCGSYSEFVSFDPDVDWAILLNRISRRKRLRILRFTASAAAIVIAVLSLIVLQIRTDSTDDRIAGKTVDLQQDVDLPSNYKAILLLPNGKEVKLEADTPIHAGNIKNESGKLEYSDTPDNYQDPVYHTLKTNKGMEYSVLLSDGSTVRLGAGSELSYPEVFSDDERVVNLTGEAFFDVSHNPDQPFVIRCGEMLVRVHGTSFNLKAYAGESRQATLVEGRISVELNGHRLNIVPGQHVRETEGGLEVHDVNVDDHLGWINNRFIFRHTSLKDVMRDIARWYDIAIEFADEAASELHLTANIPRFDSVEQVFDIIRQALYVDFVDHGEGVVVTAETPPKII